MTNKHFYRAIIIRLICISWTYSLQYLIYFSTNINLFGVLLIMLIVIGVAINTIAYFNQVNQWIASFLLGIENEDTTLKIPKNTGNKAIDEIFSGIDIV